MPRKPKPKNELSAGQRAALYLEAQEEKLRSMNLDEESKSAPAESDRPPRRRSHSRAPERASRPTPPA